MGESPCGEISDHGRAGSNGVNGKGEEQETEQNGDGEEVCACGFFTAFG